MVPPAEREYPEDPVGVEIITPSASIVVICFFFFCFFLVLVLVLILILVLVVWFLLLGGCGENGRKKKKNQSRIQIDFCCANLKIRTKNRHLIEGNIK